MTIIDHKGINSVESIHSIPIVTGFVGIDLAGNYI